MRDHVRVSPTYCTQIRSEQRNQTKQNKKCLDFTLKLRDLAATAHDKAISLPASVMRVCILRQDEPSRRHLLWALEGGLFIIYTSLQKSRMCSTNTSWFIH